MAAYSMGNIHFAEQPAVAKGGKVSMQEIPLGRRSLGDMQAQHILAFP